MSGAIQFYYFKFRIEYQFNNLKLDLITTKISYLNLNIDPRTNMNWKLIFTLSLFGLAMAVATVFWIPSNVEWIFWLVIFMFCAYTIARQADGKYFLHGFMVSIVNSIWIIVIHITFYDTYVANHPELLPRLDEMAEFANPRIFMVVIGLIIGAISGIILGLFSLVASKLIKKAPYN